VLLCKLGYTSGFATIVVIMFYSRFSALLIIVIFSVYHLCTTLLVSCLILLMFYCTYPLDLITYDFILISNCQSLLDVSFMFGVPMLTTQFSMYVI